MKRSDKDDRTTVSFDPLKANFASPARPVRAYVIASTPRSGSTLLARALWETGLAGAPHEYLNRIFVKGWSKRWGEISMPDYLARLMEINSSPNGVFGLKAHFHQLHDAVLSQGQQIEELLPKLSYIRIDRGDTIRQAISFWRAHQTNSWTKEDKVRRRPRYSYAGIHARLREIITDQKGWDRYFRERGIVPFSISYEELQGDFYATMRRVLRSLELEAAVDRIPEPPLRKQRDDITEEWCARFIEDMEPSGARLLTSKFRHWLGNRS